MEKSWMFCLERWLWYSGLYVMGAILRLSGFHIISLPCWHSPCHHVDCYINGTIISIFNGTEITSNNLDSMSLFLNHANHSNAASGFLGTNAFALALQWLSQKRLQKDNVVCPSRLWNAEWWFTYQKYKESLFYINIWHLLN